MAAVVITDYRNEGVSEKVRVGTGQHFVWREHFTTSKKKSIEINLIPVTVSHRNQSY
jgi:hypothetical protein